VTRHYEVVYIFDSALEEPAVTEHLARFNALLGGTDVKVNHWGKRTLAFPIKRHVAGYYAVTQFETDPTRLPEFERAIKLDETVVRHLTVQVEEETPAGLPAPTAVGAEEDDE